MTAKEYLNQARFLDTRINSKLLQVAELNSLATKATTTLTGMPHNPNKGKSTMEDAIVKIVDLQTDINKDIDALVSLKREILEIIKEVSNPEYQTVLERRYLCFETWEQIAVGMNYEIRWLYRIHGKALEEVQLILKRKATFDH